MHMEKIMDKMKYKARLIDETVERYLATIGAVCIEGPKWCGKTWTSSYHCNSEIMIGDPANNFQNRALAEMSPALVLGAIRRVSSTSGRKYRLSGTRCAIRWISAGKRGSSS